jgi:hypothetical protein
MMSTWRPTCCAASAIKCLYAPSRRGVSSDWFECRKLLRSRLRRLASGPATSDGRIGPLLRSPGGHLGYPGLNCGSRPLAQSAFRTHIRSKMGPPQLAASWSASDRSPFRLGLLHSRSSAIAIWSANLLSRPGRPCAAPNRARRMRHAIEAVSQRR